MHRVPWILVVGLLAAGPACSHGRGATPGVPGPQVADSASETWAPPLPVYIEVVNNYEIPMEIYADGSGIFYRMGTVAQGMRGHFVLRQALVLGGMVEFVAQPTGYGPQIRSGALQVVPGDVVDFVIATLLKGSIATVRP